MTNTTIFTADQAEASTTEQAAVQAVQTNTATQEQSDIVAALVGEGKKYKTQDELAKAYINADSFIEQLKAENRELKEKVTAAKTVDDVLERLQQQHSTSSDDHQSPPSKGVDVADLTKLVEATVTGLETQKQRHANLLKADALMKENFGEKASAKYAEVAITPELNKVYMDLAAVDPIKFVSIFTGGAKPASTGVDMGGVNTNVPYSSTTGGNRKTTSGTKEYYDNIRQTNPGKYYSQDFQMEMDNLVRRNPDLYYGKR